MLSSSVTKLEHLMRNAGKWLIIASAIVGYNTCALAQGDIDAGKIEFQSSCAVCHGADGKGNGPLSQELKSKVGSLTTLAKKNNGVFPLNTIYEIIDGRKQIATHGSRAMPIWGFRYTPSPSSAAKAAPPSSTQATPSPNQAAPSLDVWMASKPPVAFADLSYDPDSVVRNRILAIVDYLNRIQEK